MGYNFQKQIDFLLEHACPSIKYLVHRDMLNVPMNEPFMVALQNEILAQTNTQKHLAAIGNETEVDVFLKFPCFLYDPTNVDNLISGFSAFSKPSLFGGSKFGGPQFMYCSCLV